MDNLSFEDMDIYLLKQNGRIIHQIWFETGILPKRESKKMFKSLVKYRDTWIINNPTWVYKCWNLRDCRTFMKIYYPEHLEMYDQYPYQIQRCDCVRYFILYRYGGLYADMDYCCVKSWDEVLEKYPHDFYLTETPNKIRDDEVHVSNSLMYSKPNHIFWKYIFIEMEKNRTVPSYYGKHMTIMYTTGPCIVNRIYNRYKTKHHLTHYPYKYFHPFGLATDNHQTDKTTLYAYHLQKNSWGSLDSKILNFLYQDYPIVIVFVIYLILKISLRNK